MRAMRYSGSVELPNHAFEQSRTDKVPRSYVGERAAQRDR
jgi:hypothetical protein